MNNFSDKVSFIWSVADLIRDVFKRSKYQDVILPFTVLRRIDCVLEPTHQAVLKKYYEYKGQYLCQFKKKGLCGRVGVNET